MRFKKRKSRLESKAACAGCDFAFVNVIEALYLSPMTETALCACFFQCFDSFEDFVDMAGYLEPTPLFF